MEKETVKANEAGSRESKSKSERRKKKRKRKTCTCLVATTHMMTSALLKLLLRRLTLLNSGLSPFSLVPLLSKIAPAASPLIHASGSISVLMSLLIDGDPPPPGEDVDTTLPIEPALPLRPFLAAATAPRVAGFEAPGT